PAVHWGGGAFAVRWREEERQRPSVGGGFGRYRVAQDRVDREPRHRHQDGSGANERRRYGDRRRSRWRHEDGRENRKWRRTEEVRRDSGTEDARKRRSFAAGGVDLAGRGLRRVPREETRPARRRTGRRRG